LQDVVIKAEETRKSLTTEEAALMAKNYELLSQATAHSSAGVGAWAAAYSNRVKQVGTIPKTVEI